MAFFPLLIVGAVAWSFLSKRPVPETATPPARAVNEDFSPGSAPGSGAARLKPGADPTLTLDIQGPAEFKRQVTHSLKLIWMADRDMFLFFKNSLYVIRNENKTDFYLDNGRPVAAISTAHAFRSLTWCAGIIGHQAWHAWYAQKNKKKGLRAPPLPGEKSRLVVDANPMRFDYKSLEAILDMEVKASAFQLDVLRKVGAPSSETAQLLRRGPRDFTTGHDGNYSLKP